MSLLMDALRKAEQQKRMLAGQEQQPEQAPASSGELELIPHHEKPAAAEEFRPIPPVLEPARHDPAKDRLPELPTRLEELDEQFMAHAAKPVAPKPKPAPPPPQVAAPAPPPDASARDEARNLFEAKRPPANNRSFAIAVGLVTLVAAVGIGGYFWWQLQPKSGLIASSAPPRPAPTASAPPPAAPQPAVAVPPAPTFQPTPTATTAPAAPGDDAEDSLAAARKRTAAVQAQPAARPETPIRLSTGQQKTDPQLEAAYQAFSRGELDQAREAWRKVLAADPRNADALHGMAAAAQQRGDSDEAADYYLRALDADPKDALALSGLASLRASADPQLTESRLKTLLAEQPDSSYLNFALGNLYSRAARWAEAQQAFFRAHVADPANPDYLFNLAVSLDHLHQTRLAIQYYNQALTAAARQPAGFDANQVAARLKTLAPDSRH